MPYGSATMPPDPRAASTVEFRNVTKRYDAGAKNTPGAVNDLSLTVPAGKICVLVGPSGCGKTTSLKMVNRLIEPTSGQILIDGEDIAKRERALRDDRLGSEVDDLPANMEGQAKIEEHAVELADPARLEQAKPVVAGRALRVR